MVDDGRYAATVDRIVEEQAVVLIEDEGEVVEEFAVPVDRLPDDARRDGAVLDVEIRDEEIREISYEASATEERRRRLRDRFDRLSERPPEGEKEGSSSPRSQDHEDSEEQRSSDSPTQTREDDEE